MAEALRTLLADFQVRVDPEGNLRKGNAQVDALKSKFQGLGTSIASGFGGIRASLNGGFGGASGGGLLKGLFTLQNSLAALAGGFAFHKLIGVIDEIGGIGEQAAKLGVTNAEFQRLDVLAKQNATSVQALGTAFRNLANAAVQPTKETTAAFAELGVQTKSDDGTFRSRQDLFFETAGALADMGDATQRAAIAQDVFGRSAIEILPLLANGRAGIEEQRAALEQLAVVDDDSIAAADAFSDSLPALGLQFKALAGPVLRDLVIPMLGFLRDIVLTITKAFAALTKNTDFVAVAFAGLAIGLTPMIQNLRTAVALGGGWTTVAKNMGKASLGLLKTIAPLVAAFLLLEDVFVFFSGGKSLIGRGLEAAFGPGVKKNIDDLRDAAKDLWRWITGEGAGEKFKSLIAEIGLALRLMVNDVLALIPGSGRTSGLAGLEAHDAAEARTETSLDARRAGPASPGRAAALARRGIPVPPGLPSSTPAPAAGPAVDASGDRNVTINMLPGSSPGAVANAVGRELDRDRAATLSQVQ